MSILGWDLIARPFLLPVLMWQGLKIRKTALVLPEAEGPRTGEAGKGISLRILIVGDSSAAGVGVQYQDQALSGQIVKRIAAHHRIAWRLLAKSGVTTNGAHQMLLGEAKEHPATFDIAVFSLGVNDAVRFTPVWLWRRRQAKLRQILRAQFGVRLMIVPGVPPLAKFPALTPLLRWSVGSHAARLDAALAQDLKQIEDARYIPFNLPLSSESMAEDGYHPNEISYALCGQAIAEVILQNYKPTET